MFQPDVGEPTNHPGVGNFLEFINFAVRNENQTSGYHLKTCSSTETHTHTHIYIYIYI